MTKENIINEIIKTPKNSFILAGDSYLIEKGGWLQLVSPSRRDPSRNEVIHSEINKNKVESKVNEIIDFYKNIGTSFKWCTNHLTLPTNFTDTLRKKGFKSWLARWMFYDSSKLKNRQNNQLTIEKLNLQNLDEYLDAFIVGWNLNPNLRKLLEEDYLWAMSQIDKRFNYFMVKKNGDVVGTAGFVNNGQSAYLIGGNILEKHRGNGYYSALINTRLKTINELGIKIVITGAREQSSAPILEKFGFETVFQSEIFQYDFNAN